MKSAKKLREERAEKRTELENLIAKAKAEKRGFTETEETRFDELKAEVESFDTQIKRADEIEEIERAAETRKHQQRMKDREGNRGEEADKKKTVERFSFVRAMGNLVNNKPLEGIELEMHQEAQKEARDHGVNISGYGVPRMVASPEARDLTAGTATAGGNTVATDLGDLIDVLRPQLLTQQMGVQVLTGLNGNLDFPKQTSKSTANWEGETDAAAETEPTFGKVSLTAKRLAAYTEFSLQLGYQSSLDVENLVRGDLQRAIALAVDAAVINGSGSGQPTGILTLLLAGNTVAGGTNGGAPTWDNIAELEGKVATQNALLGSLGYLTTPGVKTKLKTTKIDAGSGQFVWGVNSMELNGYSAGVSTQVPSTLTKGTGTNLHAIIFGNFNDYLLGQWGGLDLVVDPYTKATEGMRRVIVNSFWDGDARNDESFSAMIDAIV